MERRRRSASEIAELVERYRTSGMTREQYCRQEGAAKSTLDRYLRRQHKGQQLVRVKLKSGSEQEGGFALVLSNGRRIETGWKFGEAELARLIRVAEAV
jgi:hypothetical protein